MSRIKPEKRAQVLAALKANKMPVFRRIAREVGDVSTTTVARIAAAEGSKSPFQGLTRSERMKRQRDNPEFLAAMVVAASQNMKRQNADPNFAAAASQRMKQQNADPAFVTKRLKALRATMQVERLRKRARLLKENG